MQDLAMPSRDDKQEKTSKLTPTKYALSPARPPLAVARIALVRDHPLALWYGLVLTTFLVLSKRRPPSSRIVSPRRMFDLDDFGSRPTQSSSANARTHIDLRTTQLDQTLYQVRFKDAWRLLVRFKNTWRLSKFVQPIGMQAHIKPERARIHHQRE